MSVTPCLTWERLTLKLRNPFRVSYGVSETRTAFLVHLAAESGVGEGTIPPYYGIDFEQMTAFWDQAAQKSEPFPETLEDIPAWVGAAGPKPARAALDIALHDRLGRQTGLPLYQLLGLPYPKPMPSSFTISIDSPEEMARMAAEKPDYPVLKIKLGTPGEEDLDRARLTAIRQARPAARLRVDANAGWSREGAVALVKMLEQFDVEMIEQPVARDDFEGMGLVQRSTGIPVVADESVQSMEDVEKLYEAGVHAINLKLMKVGGLSNGAAILRRAKEEFHMGVMLGCMIETSVGVGAMAHLMGLADWVDLDPPILISNDPYQGLTFGEDARVTAPQGAGIGVTRIREAV